MTENTLNRRVQQLSKELDSHSHLSELIELMGEQIADDTWVLEQERLPL